MKNKKIWLSILIVIIVLAVAEAITYLIMNKKDSKPVEEEYSSQVNINDANSFNPKEVNLEGFKKIDINEINMSKDFDGSYPLDKLEKLKSVKDADNEDKRFWGDNVKYTNNRLEITNMYNSEEIKDEYKDFNDLFFYSIDCIGTIFFALYDNKIIIIPDIGEIITNKSEIYGTIDSMYSIYVRSSTCGCISRFIGHSTNGKYYDMETAKEIDTTQKYLYFDYLTANRIYKSGKTNIKVKIIIYDADLDDMKMLIDKDNYLYELTYNGVKKLNKKVKTIYHKSAASYNYDDVDFASYDDFGYVYIQFEDGSYYEDEDGVKAIESYDGILY